MELKTFEIGAYCVEDKNCHMKYYDNLKEAKKEYKNKEAVAIYKYDWDKWDNCLGFIFIYGRR